MDKQPELGWFAVALPWHRQPLSCCPRPHCPQPNKPPSLHPLGPPALIPAAAAAREERFRVGRTPSRAVCQLLPAPARTPAQRPARGGDGTLRAQSSGSFLAPQQHGRTNRFGGWRGKEEGKVGPARRAGIKESQPSTGAIASRPLLCPQRCPQWHFFLPGLSMTPTATGAGQGGAELPAQPPPALAHISQESRYPSAVSRRKTKNSKQF